MKKRILDKMPEIYSKCINNEIKLAKEIYKENLHSIFLAGSVGKGLCIPGWSDIDLYIITNSLDLEANTKFYEISKNSDIHIGTTFYTIDMISKLNVDQKTKVSFYEYKNYDVNLIIYGDLDIPNISYSDILESKKVIGDYIQTVERELYIYKIDKSNLKSLVKKLTLLVKVYLRIKYKEFTFGYKYVFNTYKKLVNNNLKMDIMKVISLEDADNELITATSQIIVDILK